jgi:hypothetical protein
LVDVDPASSGTQAAAHQPKDGADELAGALKA